MIPEGFSEGPYLCRECWGSDRDCNCDEPDYAPTYFKET